MIVRKHAWSDRDTFSGKSKSRTGFNHNLNEIFQHLCIPNFHSKMPRNIIFKMLYECCIIMKSFILNNSGSYYVCICKSWLQIFHIPGV